MMDLNKSRSLLRSPVSPPETPVLPSVSVEGKAKVDKLIENVDGITLPTEDSSKCKKVYQSWFQEACTDEETLRYLIQRLHHYWLSNKTSVVKAAIFLCENWEAGIRSEIIKSWVLRLLQEDFENRQTLQAKSPEKFLNSAAFLVEIFSRVRIHAVPINCLVSPVFQYLEDLLTGDESEIELLAHLIVRVAPTIMDLEECDESSFASFSPMQTLFSKVRYTLISRNLSSHSRLWLLFIMDVSSSGTLKLPSSTLQSFYQDKDHLGESVNDLVKFLGPLNSCKGQETTSSRSESRADEDVNNHISSLTISSVPQRPRSNDTIAHSAPKKRSPIKSESEDKRENFRSAFSVDSKGSKGKSYWLHDDRFERDDTYNKDKRSEALTKPKASQGNWKQSNKCTESKDISPRASQGDWRQQMKQAQGSREITVTNPKGHPVDNLLSKAGHVQEETWDD